MALHPWGNSCFCSLLWRTFPQRPVEHVSLKGLRVVKVNRAFIYLFILNEWQRFVKKCDNLRWMKTYYPHRKYRYGHVLSIEKKFYMTHLISYQTFAGSQTGSCHCSEDQDAGSHFRQLSVRVESKSWLVLCGALCGVTAALFTAAHVCKMFTSLSASASTGQSCDWVSAARSRVPNTAWFNPARLKCCPPTIQTRWEVVHCVFTC